jgi:hypothetical protein
MTKVELLAAASRAGIKFDLEKHKIGVKTANKKIIACLKKKNKKKEEPKKEDEEEDAAAAAEHEKQLALAASLREVRQKAADLAKVNLDERKHIEETLQDAENLLAMTGYGPEEEEGEESEEEEDDEGDEEEEDEEDGSNQDEEDGSNQHEEDGSNHDEEDGEKDA